MTNWTEAERLIVEYAKDCGTKAHDALREHGRKLIAEAEPKIMSVGDLLTLYRGSRKTYNDVASIQAMHAAFLASIAAVLDKKLADANYGPGTGYPTARRIVADTLKVPS